MSDARHLAENTLSFLDTLHFWLRAGKAADAAECRVARVARSTYQGNGYLRLAHIFLANDGPSVF